MERVPAELADCIVKDENNAEVRLGDLWKSQPVVLAFVRHFGCVFCREQVTELNRALDQIEAKGATLAVVGSGTPNFIQGFREQTGFQGTILSDASLKSYQTAGMKRGFFTVINPIVAARGLGSMLRGFRQGSFQGDPYQEGGVLVIEPPGVFRMKQISSSAGDHPPVAEVIGALSSTAAA